MNYIFINFILMVVVFIGYVSFIWEKYGIQKSISASYYVLPEKHNFIFTLFCWGFGLPAIIIGNSFLMFVAGTAICFVGAAAAFRNKMEFEVHMTSALIGILSSQLSIIFDFQMFWFGFGFALFSVIILFFRKYVLNYFWWIEIAAFSTICYVLGLKCL